VPYVALEVSHRADFSMIATLPHGRGSDLGLFPGSPAGFSWVRSR
jgi:hypothetical protein